MAPAARGNLLVVCVRDDRPLLERLRADLELEGRVLAADTADAALLMVAAETVDVLVLPLVGAGPILARARELQPELPAVLLAGNATLADAAAAIVGRGPSRIVQVAGDLRDAVRQLLEEQDSRRERAAITERLQRRIDALGALHEVSLEASSVSSHAEVVDLMVRALHRIVRIDIAAALLAAEPGDTVMSVHCQAPCDEATLGAARERCLDIHRTLTGRPLGEDSLVVNFSGERLGGPRPPAQSATHVPLILEGRVVGILYVVAFRPQGFTPEDEKLLYLLAGQVTEAIRRLSTRLLDERRRMALMVESMADGVIMTDEKSEVFLINPAARRMLGIGLDIVVTGKFLKERLGFYPFDLVTRGTAREELTVDERTLHSIVSPVLDVSGKLVGTVVVLRDITEWKDLERRKEEFVSIVSHELRTPLTSIAGALDIVLKEYAGGLGDKQRRYLAIARESCSKLHVIVNDLLDVARFERGKMPMQFQPLALDRLAVECVDRFRPAAEAKQVSLHLRHSDRGDIRIVGDGDRLSQVLHNLLSNAMKFTPEGGRIELEVFGPGVASSFVGVTVWNNGEPIPEDDRERIFDKFEQVQASSTRRVGGTGLGLAISRSIVEGHGGKIWVESQPVGTKFVFTLPAAPDETAAGAKARDQGLELLPDDSTAPPTGRQVLVVDDDRYAAYLLKGLLMAAGHKVHVAHDAEEALAVARERKPDLVTVDVHMPGVDGLALVEILKHDPDTRKAGVIVVSGASDRETAVAAGADGYFSKPLDVDAFRAGCARLLAECAVTVQSKVLVVDDDPGIRMICREVLENAGYVVREAGDGEAALSEAKHFRPDLLLLDVMMPDLDGFQTAKRFRADRSGQLTPVIFVSAKGQTADKVRAFKLGAEDYLVKPFDAAELVARVEKALSRRDRELGASPTTRLPGAGSIETEIERRLADGGDFAFCYLDLDNLKAFNDYYGIAKADGIIRQTADLVREVIGRDGGAGDFIGHIAGDDFVFITTPGRADRVCRRICETFDRLVPLYYNKSDRERGYIETSDRYGQLRRFPVMSVSVASLTSSPLRRFRAYAELAAAAADAKKLAKSIEGSSYVRDGQTVFPLLARSAISG
jgi:PAS domain S-box-containing protein